MARTRSDRPRFKRGTQLRYPIRDDRGILLLKAGAFVTPKLLALFDRRGIRLILSAALEVLEGEQTGMEIPIQLPSVKIGRNQDCQIRPTSKLVSGNHCVIEKLPLSLYVRDLNSTNGTEVNGREITDPVELEDGDLLKFGDMKVRVHLYAALEGDGEEAREVASLILADRSGYTGDPVSGDTVIARIEDLEG